MIVIANGGDKLNVFTHYINLQNLYFQFIILIRLGTLRFHLNYHTIIRNTHTTMGLMI